MLRRNLGMIVTPFIYTFQRPHVIPETRSKILIMDCKTSTVTTVWLSSVIWCYLLPYLLCSKFLSVPWATTPLLTLDPPNFLEYCPFFILTPIIPPSIYPFVLLTPMHHGGSQLNVTFSGKNVFLDPSG